MDEVQSRVQKAVNGMIDTLDKDVLRTMQRDMYLCSARCCEDHNRSLDDVQRCIEKCSAPLNSAQTLVQNEIQMFQDRLQRGAMGCQDKIRDKMGPNASEDDVRKYRKEMETCILKCTDEHVDLIPSMLKRMKDTIKKGK